MPAKKVTKTKKEVSPLLKLPSSPKRKISVNFKAVGLTLAIIYLVIWILIGAFVGLVIIQSLRQGAFAGLFGPRVAVPTSDNSQAASQTIIPGIGLVDVACVKQALPQDTIQKIVTSGDASSLTADEKTKLEPCILQKEAASPSPSASPSK